LIGQPSPEGARSAPRRQPPDHLDFLDADIMGDPDFPVIAWAFPGDFKRDLTPAGIVDTMVASYRD
jgi:hypothetical protein